ncbi:MAG: hypothetical protein F4X97_11960 [Boseongicola sp. SB0662_bin_57]|nr:hypothetical protein [Boseongicola sp. SB0662_bin_57]
MLPERLCRRIELNQVGNLGSPNRQRIWPVARLGDHADSCLGKMLDSEKNRGDLLPYLGNKNVRWGSFDTSNLGQMRFEKNEHDRYGLRRGDLVICEGGEPGRCAIWKDAIPGMKIQKALHRIRTRDQLDNEFLYYWFLLAGQNGALEPYFTGTTIKHLTGKALAELRVPLPPNSEQRAISHMLGTLDDKIDLNRRMNETLEAMARAIFKDWFVDFGPTRAKAEGRAPYLAPELWDLFPDALDDDGKPVGWTLVPLSVLAEANPESWSKKNAPEEIVYVDLANTKWGSIDATHHFLWRDAPSRAKRILRPGDTIVGLVRPGNGSYAYIGTPGLTGSTGFAVLRPREPQYAELVFLSATAPENIECLAHLADGAAYPAVRPEAVEATEVVLADNAVTTSFSALIDPIFDRMERNKIECQTLAQTRDLLLPRLMSGEIRLLKAEHAMEAVK